MDKLIALKEVMESISKDSCKFFDKGNKAAGTRARKQLQELKKLAQELRVGIQETKARMGPSAVQSARFMPHEEYNPPQQDVYKAEEQPQFKMEQQGAFKVDQPSFKVEQ